MNSLGQPVPENVEQQMRDSIAMIQTLIPSALVITSMMFILFIHFSCTAFCKTL